VTIVYLVLSVALRRLMDAGDRRFLPAGIR
jgi:hypothetical protein